MNYSKFFYLAIFVIFLLASSCQKNDGESSSTPTNPEPEDGQLYGQIYINGLPELNLNYQWGSGSKNACYHAKVEYHGTDNGEKSINGNINTHVDPTGPITFTLYVLPGIYTLTIKNQYLEPLTIPDTIPNYYSSNIYNITTIGASPITVYENQTTSLGNIYVEL